MNDELKLDDPKLRMILEKTNELFLEFGVRNLNMDDISRNLGISKKTLYQHVKSKEDLIYKFFCLDEMRWESEIQELGKEGLNAIEILLKASLMVHKEIGKLDSKLKFELKKYYEPVFKQFIDKRHSHIFNLISLNTQQGIEQGLYRSDLNIELVAGLYVRTLVDMHNTEFCFLENVPFDQMFKFLFESHIRAISTPEGIAYFERRKAEIEQTNR